MRFFRPLLPLLCLALVTDGLAQPPRWHPTRPTADAVEISRDEIPHPPHRLAQADADIQNKDDPFADEALPQGDVQFDFGQEVDLKAFVQYVSRRLGINMLYDDALLTDKVNIRTASAVPIDVLLPLLQNTLKMKGLALENAEVNGWKRIIRAEQLATLAPFSSAPSDGKMHSGVAVTQTFILKNADVTVAEESIRPFLTQSGGNSLVLAEQRTLVITDYASNVAKVGELLKLLDQPTPQVTTRLLSLKHANATDLGPRINELLTAQASMTASVGDQANTAAKRVDVSIDARTNRLIVVGLPKEIVEVEALVKTFDVAVSIETKAYALKNTSAERVNTLLGELLGSSIEAGEFTSAVDAENNQLMVTAAPSVHIRIDSLVKSTDIAPTQDQRRLRYYRLQNVTALELLQTLRALEGDDGQSRVFGGEASGRVRGVSGGTRGPFYPGSNQPVSPNTSRPFVPGPNSPSFPGQSLPSPPSFQENDVRRGQSPDGRELSPADLPEGKAKITADESSNTLIIIADPDVQRSYADLIKTLDKRRPQVLIEARLVVIDSSDEFSLGVEISGGDRQGSRRQFAFSSYGLSSIDPATGALSILPGTGFNGALIDPDVADVVIRALSRHRRARVLSSPRVLVNDNATGVLTSVDEVPFASVNASNVVATTSFAGFAEAGTTIEVTPHISADDHLRLEYRIILNTFTGLGGDGIPPPRKTDEVSSVVTIPDGHTVIVGGLSRRSDTNEQEGIPLIENIPFLRRLGGAESSLGSGNSLFVFLRPLILRDDKFEHLRHISAQDVDRAAIRGDDPRSVPLRMK